MSATPRVRSGAFPQTPGTIGRGGPRGAPPTPSPSPSPPAPRRAADRSPLPEAPQDKRTSASSATAPVIPLHILDAPTQRFYACAFYIALLAWRFYDWVQLVEDNAESFWLFLKWIGIDFVFLFGLPELRIPWLQLAQPVVIALFLSHVVFDYMLMFNVHLPWTAWLVGLAKVLYDRELSISEHYVKTSSIIHNSSLIMGKQIINILPEGSAVLNPDRVPFCVGGGIRNAVTIPLYFNATVPAEVELVRVDLDTNEEESMKLTRSQLRDIERLTKRQSTDGAPVTVKYDYPVKKTGAYRLGRVLDEYKLEVQRTTPYTFVVACPTARVEKAASHSSSQVAERCLGDLSDLRLQVDGTPPLKIVYSRTINGKDHSFHFQSLQPDDFSSPLLGAPPRSSLSLDLSSKFAPPLGDINEDISWARSRRVTVGLNESMPVGGEWQYSIDEVTDAFGNVAKYTSPADELETRPKPKHLVQNFLVKERPKIRMQGCEAGQSLKVAKGRTAPLPVRYEISGAAAATAQDTAHTITWKFSPEGTLTVNGDHGDVVTTGSYRAKNAYDRPDISEPGLYTLTSVSSGSCEGEVQEPASCVLYNPPEPRLSLSAKDIPDTCAGHSVGLLVDLDLAGTPPFVVRYDVISNGTPRQEKVTVPGTRYQIQLVPRVAGHHKYVFTAIDDAVYKAQPLTGPMMVLEQDVKPAARASIAESTDKINACLQEEVGIMVSLSGEAPFTLEYQLAHEGKKKQYRVTGIEDTRYQIRTESLLQGGEYTLALTNIEDRSGCRHALQGDELKIMVRRQRPRVGFGLIDNKRSTMVVEGAKTKVPMRLTGEGPWKIFYRNANASSEVYQKTLHSGNDFLEVSDRGVYEVLDVYDNQCHGTVDAAASTFVVGWFPRPELAIVETDSISRHGDKYVKQDICEGDNDGFEIDLKGIPPYHVEYEIRHKPRYGSQSSAHKELDAALSRASIQMDTARPGLYTYKFSALEDSLYHGKQAKFTPLVLEQTVNVRPRAAFVKPGQSFKYCMTEQEDEEKIPIMLAGTPPFSVEFEIKHQSGATSDTYRVSSIQALEYGLRIPRSYLRPGTQQVRISKVRDARGCEHRAEAVTGAPSVQVQLFEAPAIFPLETRTDYCVGERIAYTLSGTPPFEVWYTFDGSARKAKSGTTSFRRVAEAPGEFTITGVNDRASECRAAVNLTRTIHPLPSVRISKGRNVRVDIHEGGEVEILFEFGGTPPFEFTYTRSTNARKGAKSQVLETRHDVSYEHSKVVRASQEGTYEVVAIKDQFCAFSTQAYGEPKDGQKRLT